jgi:predicted ATPase
VPPICLVLLAAAIGHVGQVQEGPHLVAESWTVLEANEQWDLQAETYRLQGELLLRQAALYMVQAEVCIQRAKSWELRTTRGLSRSWQQQNKRDETPELLAPIYTWFTEGFDTADRQEAKALLEGLS